jgi:hypothetical protein
MKLIEALEVIKQPVPEGASQLKVYLSRRFTFRLFWLRNSKTGHHGAGL